MTKRFTLLTAAALIAVALPLGAAQAQQVSVRIDTPDIGVRIGTPYPPPVYAPVYAPPPVLFAPAPVYYSAPRYVFAPTPRVFVPAPVVYRSPWYGSRAYRYKHWKRYRDWND